MSVTDTMRWMGRSARNRAEVMSHQVKDRALQLRLERAAEENDRLRTENETLRDSVEESRADHRRILDMLESRLVAVSAGDDDVDVHVEKKSHRGRRLLFLIMLGGAAWAWIRSKAGRDSTEDIWGERPGSTTGTGMTGSSGTSTGTTGSSGSSGPTGSGGTSGDPGMAA